MSAAKGAITRDTRPLTAGDWRQLGLTLTAPAPDHPGFAPEVLQAAVRGACEAEALPCPGELAHRFEPQGLSLLLFGPALRLALHTWPERGLTTLDLYAPGAAGPLERVAERIAQSLGWRISESNDTMRRPETGAIRNPGDTP